MSDSTKPGVPEDQRGSGTLVAETRSGQDLGRGNVSRGGGMDVSPTPVSGRPPFEKSDLPEGPVHPRGEALDEASPEGLKAAKSAVNRGVHGKADKPGPYR